ncbi:MAG: glucosidase [Blastocatellia bacterium]|nr:glucosidase [Blastocatellia bacterium]
METTENQSEDIEFARLKEANAGKANWKKWGPYLSERQWGTVREDFSDDGNAWNYFTHDQARSRTYLWGEDGLAGISDDHQLLCFALALWNGADPILKERAFGLTNNEGNHGEDVKEYYFYLDNTPTHSYMKYLYKYPQRAFPYLDLVEGNRKRSREELEYELIDTGIFDDDRYFDVFVEYAKASPEDILVKISVSNRGPESAIIHLLPTIWFRNTWTLWPELRKPVLYEGERTSGTGTISVSHPHLGNYFMYCEGASSLLFTENETNNERLFGTKNQTRYVKDGINDFIVNGRTDAVNQAKSGTKAAAHYRLSVGPGATEVIRLRLRNASVDEGVRLFGLNFDETFGSRRKDADEFYRQRTPPSASEDEARIMRQALAGMLWTKQYYYFDVDRWLDDRAAHPLHDGTRNVRNKDWYHMLNAHIISMPDKWEYPWYAAWDLAFHTIALSTVDLDFAKDQLDLMLTEHYLHPSGQIPAYEWNFSDVNPPVHAWATLFLHTSEQALHGEADIEFLKKSFAKLLINFTWWVNRKDRFGKNVFEGGFLGLDNIGVFDRSAPLPTGGYLEQADGTAWMAMFCQTMAELSFDMAVQDPSYENMIGKFLEHFLWIAAAANRLGHDGMWDEEDGFYYDVLRLPDGNAMRLKVRSLVGLLPICATTVFEKSQRESAPQAMEEFYQRLRRMPVLMKSIHPTGPGNYGVHERGIIALVNADKLRRILARMLDENEFLSPYGIRSLSRYHADHPYVFQVGGNNYEVKYLPAESDSGMFGGNSNWRGPIWFPMNVLIIRSLLQFYAYYGDSFKVECPTGSGKMMNLFEVSKVISSRLTNIFMRDERGKRPVFGGTEKFQSDKYWRDHMLFYEYFNGDNGAGLGASHQTGWTGLVAKLIQLFGFLDAQQVLETDYSILIQKRIQEKARAAKYAEAATMQTGS